jgi:Spy/CpxP family protein refolding chaperone
MKRSQMAVALYAVLTFASGVAVGVLGHRAYLASAQPQERPRRPDDFRKKYVEEMHSRLRLNEQQVTQLNAILDATREQYRKLRERERPEIEAIQADQRVRIRAILNPEQQAEYAKMLEEREKKMRESKGPPPR